MQWRAITITPIATPNPRAALERALPALIAGLLLCAAALPRTARADLLDIVPADDAYVESQYPTSNFGAANTLYAGDENYNEPAAVCRSYLRLNLAALPGNAQIQSAELYARSWGVGPNPPIVAGAHFLPADGWNEATITWTNAPTNFNATPADLQTVQNTATWYVWDVTADAQAQANGDGVLSVVLKSTTEGSHSWCGLSSKEEPGTQFDPYLHVTYTTTVEQDFVALQDLTGVFESDAAWGDFDGDGDLDLVLCGESDAGLVTRTYENQGGTLVLYQDLIGVYGTGSGCLAWGDADGDGDLDLALAGLADADRVARIYVNDGSGNLTHDAAQVLTGVNAASVAWADFDLDGDLDLAVMGYDGSTRQTTLYANDGSGNLTDAGAALTGLAGGSADWADWDGDGDPDLLVSGSDGTDRRVIFYRNEPAGTLVDDGDHGLPGVSLSDAAWGDCDADGDLDLALTGEAGGAGHLARVYLNDGSGGLTQVADVLSIYRSSCAWGDYDNDGDLDVAFCGYTGTGLYTVICRNDAGVFNGQPFSLPSVREGSLCWADVDRDGDLDFLVTGADWGTKYARLHDNVCPTPNTAPSAPAVLTGQQLQVPGGVQLSWQGASDAETAASGLYYCLRVGTTPGGNDVVSGTYGTPLMGNVGQATAIDLDLPPATYYWSVRTIDSGFMASDWAPEETCEPIDVQIQTIHPSDDAFVDSSAPGTPFGVAMPNDLYAGDRTAMPSISRSYLKFQVNALPAGDVVQATLHLHRYGGGGAPQYVDVYKEGIDNWDENTITWANAPTMFSPAPSWTVRVDQAGWCVWDVTQDVITEAQVDGVLTAVLRSGTPPEGTPLFLSEFWSDEYSVTQLRPYLEVIVATTTGVADPAGAGTAPRGGRVLLLEAATPNPFNPRTTIHYTVPAAAAGRVRLGVYDAAGRSIATLADELASAGRHAVDWDGRDGAGRAVASGVYFYRLEAGGALETRRMTLVK